MAIFTTITTIISNINLKLILKAVKPMLFMMLFLMIFNIFLIKTGELLVSLGFIKIYSDALLQSAYIFIRLVLIITMTTILTSSTKTAQETLCPDRQEIWMQCVTWFLMLFILALRISLYF